MKSEFIHLHNHSDYSLLDGAQKIDELLETITNLNMDSVGPFYNIEENIEITGWEPVLGGQLAEKAVWVDEAKCIGCQYCVHVASNTFLVDEFHGRSRAMRQDGDSVDVIQEAIDTCPVDCIHWVKFEELNDLENSLDRDMFQSFGKPPRMNKH